MHSETFADVLKQAGGKVELQLYKGKTHTDVFLQVGYLEYQNMSAEAISLRFLCFLVFKALS
jgi:acetyl esterase/lipase